MVLLRLLKSGSIKLYEQDCGRCNIQIGFVLIITAVLLFAMLQNVAALILV